MDRRNQRNRRQRDPYVGNPREAKISVWVDYENCIFPSGSKPEQLPYNIRKALDLVGYTGHMEIRSFTDVSFQDKKVAQCLRSARVESTHVPAGKEAADKKMISDMVFWANENPPPSVFFLISGDGGFSYNLSKLGMLNHPTLVARPRDMKTKTSRYLFSSALLVWDWPTLALGTCFAPLSAADVAYEIRYRIAAEPEPSTPHSSNKRPKKKTRRGSESGSGH